MTGSVPVSAMDSRARERVQACLTVILEELLDDEEEKCEGIFPVRFLSEHFLRQRSVKIPQTSNYADVTVSAYTLDD